MGVSIVEGFYEAVGVYTPYTQLNVDPVMLQSLGFTPEEISTLQYIVSTGGSISRASLMNYGLPYELASRIKYMYDIVTGRVSIESTDDLARHLRKMFGNHRKIGITDLALSKIKKVPRKAVVAGIKDEVFSIYNSSGYKPEERIYDVVDVTSERIFIKTKRKPVLKYGQQKKIDGVIEIVEVKPDKKVVVAVNKKYARLCNRFVIVGSLRRPEFHHGLVEIICIEGTKIYIFARSIGTKETVRYSNTQRVYDYGFLPNEIQPKLIKVASELYPTVCGVYAASYPPNSDYSVIIEEGNNGSSESNDVAF